MQQIAAASQASPLLSLAMTLANLRVADDGPGDVKDGNIDSTSSVPVRRDYESVFHARNVASILASLLPADGLIDFLTRSDCSVTVGL